MNEKMLNALSSAIYMSRLMLEGKQVEDDDQKIKASGLYLDWVKGNHTVGEILNTHAGNGLGSEWEQTWECFQAYDNSVYPDIVPGNAAWYTFNRPLHGKSPDTARPYVPVQGAHDMYHQGEFMVWTDGNIYECIDPNGTAYSPGDYAAAWQKWEG